MSASSGRKLAKDLTVGPVIPTMIRFAIPIILANLLHTAYNMVDTMVVGRMLGSNALSAVSIGSDVMLLINLSCNGLCSGAQIIIGQHFGKKDKSEVMNCCFGTLITVFLLLALGLMAVMIALASPLVTILNTPDEIRKETLVYMVTCFVGLISIFGYNVLGAIQRGMGDSKSPLLFVGVASVVNLVLDLILVPLLGVFGAAFATVLAQTVSFVWAFVFLYRRRERFAFDFKRTSFIPDKEIAGQFFKVGLPICLQNMLMQCATLFVNSFIFAYGVAATSVNGIGNKLGSVAIIVTNALSRSGAVMTAQNIAAGKTDRVRWAYLFCAAATTIFAVFLSAIAILFRKEVFGLFVIDSEVIELSALFLPVLILRFFGFATRATNLSLINGIGKPKLNLAIGILDGFVLRVGMSMLLGQVFGLGLQGYWYGVAIGGFSPMIIGLPYFLSGKWKTEKLVTQNKSED